MTERELAELMTSTDEDTKVFAKDLLTEILPTSNHDAINRWSPKRTRSLSSLDGLIAPYGERHPVYRLVDRRRKSTHPQLNVNTNDRNFQESYSPELLSDDEKLSQK